VANKLQQQVAVRQLGIAGVEKTPRRRSCVLHSTT